MWQGACHAPCERSLPECVRLAPGAWRVAQALFYCRARAVYFVGSVMSRRSELAPDWVPGIECGRLSIRLRASDEARFRREKEGTVNERPFRVLGVHHIAIGGLRREALRHLWVDLLGLTVVGGFRSPAENVDEDILVTGHGPLHVEVDLMEPVDPERRPRVHEPVLNHVGLWVDDLRAAVDWLQQRGVRFAPGGIRVGAAGYEVCFIHPKGDERFPFGGEGVLIELVQAPPQVIAAYREHVRR